MTNKCLGISGQRRAIVLGVFLGNLIVLNSAGQDLPECSQTALVRSDVIEIDVFGQSLALTNNNLVVGAPQIRVVTGLPGRVYVFQWDQGVGGWMQSAILTPSFQNPGNEFGSDVATDDAVLVVGARRDDVVALGDEQGSAWVFRFNQGTGNWMVVGRLIAGDGMPDDDFGASVGLSQDAIIVGSPADDDDGCNPDPGLCESFGGAYIFRCDGANWVEEAKLQASDGAAFDRFGQAVDIVGDVAIVGSYLDDDAGVESGSVYVFKKIAGNWVQTGKITAFDGSAGDEFGRALDYDGMTLAIGAPRHDYGEVDRGAVYLYEDDGTPDWLIKAKLTPPMNLDNRDDFFGRTVALDGSRIAVGGALTLTDRAAHVYENVEGVWTHRVRTVSYAPVTNASFGFDVALRDDTLAVAAPTTDSPVAEWVGAVYVHENIFISDCNSNCIDDLEEVSGGTEFDCNSNGVLDSCDLATLASVDCDNNLIPDECEDCNSNGIADACELAGAFSFDSPQLSPIGLGFPVAQTVIAPPQALSDVVLDFSAIADVGGTFKSLDVILNGDTLGTIFKTVGTFSCPATPEISQLIVPMATYNAMVDGGDAAFTIQTFDGIDFAACDGSSWVAFTMSYTGPPAAADVNGNGLPDECDLARGDSDLDGIVGINDFLAVLANWGGCAAPCPEDADLDGVVGILDFLNVLANWG